MEQDIFRGNGVEVTLSDPDAFLKIRETLTRIGIPSKKSNTLYQSCHILHKRGRYAIIHFKEMFILDGKYSSLDDDDLDRRNTICKLLADWGLLKVLDENLIIQRAPMSQIKIIPYKEKEDWELVSKYSVGTKKQD
jgi:hypothetical protein